MKFFNYSHPAWLMLALGVFMAIFVPLIPNVKTHFVYGLAMICIGFGLLGLYAFWVEWKDLQKRRNTYHIEPFKKRLEKYQKRHQFNRKG